MNSLEPYKRKLMGSRVCLHMYLKMCIQSCAHVFMGCQDGLGMRTAVCVWRKTLHSGFPGEEVLLSK